MEENTNSVFREMAVKKMEKQEQKTTALEQKLNSIPDNSADIQDIKKEVVEIKAEVKNARFPVKAMQEFSAQLATGIAILQKPIENKVVHHHSIPKLVWITAGLFIVLSLVCSGWYMTANNLDQYREADTKYRYLKLKSDNPMQQFLSRADSLYHSGYAIKDSVGRWEEDIKNAVELNRLLEQKRIEDAKLKTKLDVLDRQNETRKKQR